MKKLMFSLLLSAFVIPAQNALWIDLSGEWRHSVEDRPEFAFPEFDHSQWETMRLPINDRLRLGGWFRKKVELPAGSDPTQLALTLGTIQRRYEVFVNGARIGANGNFDSLDEAQIFRPITFPVPIQAVSTRGSLLVAIRLGPSITMHPALRLPDRGPYLLTYRVNAPGEAGLHALDRHRIENGPALIVAVVFLGIAGLSFLGWLGERARKELLWFAILALTRGLEWLKLLSELNPSSYPFRSVPEVSGLLLEGLTYVAFGEVVLRALGYRNRWLRWALWLGWAVAPATYLTGGSRFRGFSISNCWCTLLALGVILWDWRPASARRASWGDHSVRLALTLAALVNVDFWLGQLFRWRNLMPRFFYWSGYQVNPSDVFWMVVCAAILALLIRRVAAERHEKQQLAGELEAARVVQQLLLPRSHVTSAAYQVEAVYEPAQQVGGDFHWNRAASDGTLIVVVGDVSGKGLKAAMLVSVTIGILRNEKSATPAAILYALNEGLSGYTGDGFVTCCCARFDPDGAVTIANAGHVPPYIDGREIELTSGLPLGIATNSVYAESIARGDRFAFVSDGVVEAANAKCELFGFDRAAAVSNQPARFIAEAARAWGQNDDITVVTVTRAEVES